MNYHDPEKLTAAMKEGLARMYADDGFRSYLINAINIANHNVLACVKAGEAEKAKDFAARMDALEKLLEKGEVLFHNAEKLRRSTLSEQVEAKENATHQEQKQESSQ